MTCRRAATWLQLYVDGQLSVRRLARLEEHLEVCAACRNDLTVLEAICQTSAALDYESEPADLTAAIMRRIGELEERRVAARGERAFGPGWADALLAAVLATLATAVFLAFQPGLWRMASLALTRMFAGVATDVSAWSPWVAWVVWVGVGLTLAIWFAGGEVRAGWRRTLTARLSR
jgi:anti-sigma factor RsiW